MSEFIDKIAAWDEKVSKKIVLFSEKRLKYASFIALSGNVQPWLIMSILFFVFNLFIDRSFNLVQIVLTLFAGILISICKYSVKRRRPSVTISKKYVGKGDFYSFPSGHSGRMGCIALLFAVKYPFIGWVFVLWAIGVAYSRVALQLHYFLDVFFGILIGCFSAIIAFIFYSQIVNLLSPIVEWMNILI